MSDVILKVENVSKLYRLGTVGTGTFGGDVQRFWKTKILGQEDPFLKVGQINDRSSKEKSEFVWALKDINFELKRGEVLGIIGKNGAGKSTLLKLLSRITSPTTGSIKSAGRMASLLEVGTGFHPELTGRENIFLNGAILGMTKKEIESKFDEIVDFSGCELYIDTPTKRYSSGMTVRLGFAVAAFLDPEILVVDEVLAVGDAEFQKKAIGKMKEVSEGGGRTVLFVSHNMDSVRRLCTKGILLKNGELTYSGVINDTINKYLATNSTNISEVVIEHPKPNILPFNVQYVAILNSNYIVENVIRMGTTMVLKILISKNQNLDDFELTLQIVNSNNTPIYHMISADAGFEINMSQGVNEIQVELENVNLYPGEYFLNVNLSNKYGNKVYQRLEHVISFEVIQNIDYTMRNLPLSVGAVHIVPKWTEII